jgi:uncharacterized protein
VKFSRRLNPEHACVLFTKNLEGKKVVRTDDDLLAQLKLLPYEMDFDYFDGDANSLLYFLACHNLVESITYLLDVRKVDPNLRVSDGLTAAHIAAFYGHSESLAVLVADRRTQLDIQDRFKETALYRAVGHAPCDKLFETISVLISRMTPEALAIKNEDGYEPLMIAFTRKVSSVVSLLLSAGCNVSSHCFYAAARLDSEMSDEVEQSTLRKVTVFSPTSKQEKMECLTSVKLIMDAFKSQNGDVLIVGSRAASIRP